MTEVDEAETHNEIEYAYTDIEIGHVLDKNLERLTMTKNHTYWKDVIWNRLTKVRIEKQL